MILVVFVEISMMLPVLAARPQAMNALSLQANACIVSTFIVLKSGQKENVMILIAPCAGRNGSTVKNKRLTTKLQKEEEEVYFRLLFLIGSII